ncbi:MAG: hypothetical protein LBJ69_01555 [Holosporales bacterium]|nr:hypothetical protein [Holosporales bacterium]
MCYRHSRGVWKPRSSRERESPLARTVFGQLDEALRAIGDIQLQITQGSSAPGAIPGTTIREQIL